MELLWSGVSLDVLLLVLALAAFVAGLVAIFREDAAPEVVEDAKSESVSQSESTPKAREDLPEPEPEGEEERCLEATLERLPGEAWGLAWNKVAYAQQRLLVAAVDPNSPAGRWQQERKAQGLPTLELGDELISANDVTQHSSMQITLVATWQAANDNTCG
ncbi:unnamed protein product [Effrenium voratum]|uniref:Uncharacterized protein n=1 Tax=Effrenium voratum TaxID=2562239 RepID=A0AA36I4K0_9DINO|nr:unnamed protein product [Effrenium voratum]